MVESADRQHTAGAVNRSPPRIGLALSGGGFRAALFHLGVIRRLEELGVMKYVQTISAVSGGAIIAAYYATEMEKHLRRRAADPRGHESIDAVRLEIFEEITACFFQGLDHNMRSRALVFMPFYHPLLFIRAVVRRNYSRSDIMQREYDKWFYGKATLDHLPSVTWSPSQGTSDPHPRTGPGIILNTTSLLNGERRSFARVPVMGLRQLHRVNRNVIPISRVVGASSGVPGVFPPTVVFGDRLVDGGVSDNQGTDALIEEFSDQDAGQPEGLTGRPDVLLVSDASGQMEPVHRVRNRALPVVLRTSSILQFQLRKKTIGHLLAWKDQENGREREFAFVHLLLNLKDRDKASPGEEGEQTGTDGSGSGGQMPRVPTEYIAPLSEIRTDLDQFNPIERECLMYHGYTLIDAQIRKHCQGLGQWVQSRFDSGGWPAFRTPPLFRERPDDHKEVEPCAGEGRRRRRVQKVLRLGRESFFLIRSVKRHWSARWTCCAVTTCLLLAVIIGVAGHALLRALLSAGGIAHGFRKIVGSLDGLSTAPVWMETCILFLVVGMLGAVLSYVALFLGFASMRRLAKRWDADDYHDLTSENPGVQWRPDPHRGERVEA